MNKIILILILNISLIYSQNSDPIQRQFSYGADTITKFYINSKHQLFKQNHFIKGWQWDSKKKINEALN